MKRLWIDIQGDIFDIWHVKSAEREDEYNDLTGQMDYLLILNKASDMGDIKCKTYRYTDMDERDEALYKLKDAILNSPGMYFVGETDGALEDEDMKPKNNKEDSEEEEFDEDLDGHDFENDKE